jgi:hypothetical protein
MRVTEFLDGFYHITSKLKEMYQVSNEVRLVLDIFTFQRIKRKTSTCISAIEVNINARRQFGTLPCLIQS